MHAIGRAFIKVNGALLRSNPGAKINLGGYKRDPVVTDSDVFFTESFEPAKVECELTLDKNDSLEGLRNAAGVTVTFEGDNGITWLVRDAFLEATLTVTAQEGGKIPVTLTGKPAEEL